MKGSGWRVVESGKWKVGSGWWVMGGVWWVKWVRVMVRVRDRVKVRVITSVEQRSPTV